MLDVRFAAGVPCCAALLLLLLPPPLAVDGAQTPTLLLLLLLPLSCRALTWSPQAQWLRESERAGRLEEEIAAESARVCKARAVPAARLLPDSKD